ncbi:MAG: translation elongation factor Ts [Eubacteriales bacterium]|nr:translation elongation factor Ts [Eubacteriales bacterium]
MADIDINLIKQLREMTGSGMVDVRKALEATDGDLDKAVNWLREKGMAGASKRASKVAAEGIVDSYIHGDRVGVLVEVNIETDFAAQNEKFKELVHEISMQIAAMNPKWVRREEVPEEVLENERGVARTQALNEGKPEKIIDRIIEGRLEKFYEANVLEDQPYIKDDSKTISDLVKETIAVIGENIRIRRFARFEVGEGIEKKEEDFQQEVMDQLNRK